MAATLLDAAKNKLYLYVGIMDSLNGRKLQRLTPDEDGYYNNIPLSAFNAKSLNGCYYDTESYLKGLKDPSSTFNLKLTHGNLYGEWGHPKDDQDLRRICGIDREKVSHHFRSIYAGEPIAGTETVIYGSLRPSGPWGKYLSDSLMNPHENTAFSLRCLMTEKYDRGLRAQMRTIEEFVTYDAVDMPGYLYGSKWYVEATAVGRECLMPVTMDMLYTPSGKRVALESLSDTRLLELFGIKDFDLNGKPLGNYITGTNTYRDPKGTNRSLVHQAISGKFF